MKKIILFLCMILFITNVKALSFDLNLTDIEYKGNNSTTGEVSNIDVDNMSLDVLFKDIGDEVSFELTIVNTGERAGTLKNIVPTGGNSHIEYITNIPEGGLPIDGNGINKVLITAKLKDGAENSTSVSELKVSYNYQEGSCPEGETLSPDESMCLCPAGTERTDTGVCVESKIECSADEIYNEEKQGCEKKIVPVNPDNPKTLDNIILITLLFVVSGLGIYAVMYSKLNNDKKKIIVGVITGVITLSAAFTTLVTTFGLDNLLSYVNPVTKEKELKLTINETVELVEKCTLENNLCPQYLLSSKWNNVNHRYDYTWTINKDDLKELQSSNTYYPEVYIMKDKDEISLCYVESGVEYCIPKEYELSIIFDQCEELGGVLSGSLGSGEVFDCENTEYMDEGLFKYKVTLWDYDYIGYRYSRVNKAYNDDEGNCEISQAISDDYGLYETMFCEYEHSDNVYEVGN